MQLLWARNLGDGLIRQFWIKTSDEVIGKCPKCSIWRLYLGQNGSYVCGWQVGDGCWWKAQVPLNGISAQVTWMPSWPWHDSSLSPNQELEKGRRRDLFYDSALEPTVSSASFYSLEGSQGVVEFSSPSKEDGLASAFERKMHQRICKCILKLPHQIPIILDFILPIYFAYMIIPTYYPYNVSIFLFSISKCDQKATVGGMVLPDTPNEGLDNII